MRLIPVVAVLLSLAACASSAPEKRATRKPAAPARSAPDEIDAPELPGVMVTVAAGDTLWSIAERHGTTVDEIAEVNGLEDADELAVGQHLFIPERDPMAPAQERPLLPRPEPPPAPPSDAPLIWPVAEGVLFSEFGPRQGSFHDGIDLGAPEGTPVLAAADGKVVFVGDNQGAFGSIVILAHDGDHVTVYAHNQANLVKDGQVVKKGQVIARLGKSGMTQSPHVHFEVRRGRKAVDPITVLPPE